MQKGLGTKQGFPNTALIIGRYGKHRGEVTTCNCGKAREKSQKFNREQARESNARNNWQTREKQKHVSGGPFDLFGGLTFLWRREGDLKIIS